jgi:hypothetical protein
LLEEYSEVPVARRVCNHPVHDPTELALLYFVGALAEAPASARLDTSDPADRMTSAAAIMTRILYIPSSSCSRQLNRTSFTFPDAGLSARAWLTMIPKFAVRKH